VTFAALESTNIYVQAGSFIDYNNATRLQESLDRVARTSIEPASVDNRNFYRVRLGPLASVDEADRVLEELFRDGHRQARVIVD
jgi:rare lipoprotein A